MGIAISMLLGARVTTENANLPRTKVKLSNDCWLDVLKFLTCAEWSEKRCVSRQINGIAERNISHLPRVIIEKAILGEKRSMPKLLRDLSGIDDAIVAFGAVIPQNKIERWFVNRGTTLEERVKVQLLFTRIRSGGFLTEYHSDFADICILGQAQQVQKSWFDQLFANQYESVLFYAHFSSSRKYSWPAMEQFLTFLFHPSSYIKVVEMYTVNQTFVDTVKEKFSIPGNTMRAQKTNTNKPFYIHCETFSLLSKSGMNVDGLCNALIWLEQNVRAESIRMPFVYTHSMDRAAVCCLLNNFVFGALRVCAKLELRLNYRTETKLLISLVEKFWTLSRIKHDIPTIVIESFSLRDFEKIQPYLGPNVIHQEVDSQRPGFLYVFENGHNRMRISFCKSSDNHWGYDCYVKFYAIQQFI
ncbi:hypothetical protein Ddc_15203 [Ditylenchus destructor]|nr:hypothetical protein Ddc_15203 [Ditylenchus destructor]